ncbi:MAG: 3-phosphoglycerate dehydrogenase [Bacteroidales bacterium]|nr:3-phosphoglycerate dehydrogenase [Bacteroidales bacterium]
MKKILVATVKPFHPDAVEGIREICSKAGYDFNLLEKYNDKSELLEAVADAHALIVRSDKVTSEVIEAGKNLEIIVRGGAGYDNVDLKTASDKGIVVMNTPGQNSNAVAELALGMMVFFARNQFNGKAGTELRGKTLGVHAFGNVGQLVAEIAHGFNMDIYAYDPFEKDEVIRKKGVTPVKSAEELYEKCQYVSLHIPANGDTRESINYALLSRMPANATLVNTARKEVIDEEGLKKVMSKREDFNYISDIAPDCKDEMAEKYPGRFFFTPKKMGAQTSEANINAGLAAISQIKNYFENGDKTYQVN